MEVESGSNPRWDKVQPFISRFRIGARTNPDESRSAVCIFVAEDNPGDVGLLRVALEEHGVNCELLVAADGERALQFIEQIGAGSLGCPALAILDLNLPRKTGREVLQRIAESPNWKGVPVVILSSSDSEKDKIETAQLGARKYIRKPSSLEAFVQIGGVLKSLLATPV